MQKAIYNIYYCVNEKKIILINLMEVVSNENFNKNKFLTPNCVYDSETSLKYNFGGGNFIKFLKILPNNEEFLIITNKNEILKLKLFCEENNKFCLFPDQNTSDISTEISFKFKETNYIYDFDM